MSLTERILAAKEGVWITLNSISPVDMLRRVVAYSAANCGRGRPSNRKEGSAMGKRLRTVIALVTICVASASVTPAFAVATTVTFDDVAPQSAIGNFLSQGFRFSSRSYFHIDPGAFYPYGSPNPNYHGYLDSQFFAFGNSGCNPDFIGPEYGFAACEPGPKPSLLVVDQFGLPFSLTSIFGVLGESCVLGIASSKGGTATINSCNDGITLTPQLFEFTGPEWTGIRWLSFGIEYDPSVGFDHISFRTGLPEPGTLGLLGLGLVGLGSTYRSGSRKGSSNATHRGSAT